MHQAFIKVCIEIFIALGGVAAATKWALSSEEEALKKGLDKLLSDPKYRVFLLKWRPQIEAALDTLDKVAKQELEQAQKSEPNSEPKKP